MVQTTAIVVVKLVSPTWSRVMAFFGSSDLLRLDRHALFE